MVNLLSYPLLSYSLCSFARSPVHGTLANPAWHLPHFFRAFQQVVGGVEARQGVKRNLKNIYHEFKNLLSTLVLDYISLRPDKAILLLIIIIVIVHK